MAFRKGQSGNPGGRPKRAKEFTELARDFMTRKGITRLIAMADDPESPHHFSALKELGDRAFGKSPLVLAGAGGVGPAAISISWEEVKP